ncbi:hypothetical protein M3J07_002494 [Ascochyta lentis]
MAPPRLPTALRSPYKKALGKPAALLLQILPLPPLARPRGQGSRQKTSSWRTRRLRKPSTMFPLTISLGFRVTRTTVVAEVLLRVVLRSSLVCSV